ncbi:restriction endonuclease [Sulfolobales archaeon HS-7]|nr:restriction endonuclease [Sulfolobales archaeon HS-7]
MTEIDLPRFDEFLAPILRFASDGKEHDLSETIEEMSRQFNLNEEQRNRLMPNGTRTYIYDRISWAITYLVQAGLLIRTGRSKYKISDEGKNEAKIIPERVRYTYLEKFPSFVEFIGTKRNKGRNKPNYQKEMKEPESTPDEEIAEIFKKRDKILANDLLNVLSNVKPADFERIIIDLVLALGYGKNFEELANVLGQPNDQGIDGEISQDKLGFDKIYLQAKRWNRNQTVGAKEIRDFIGALTIKHAKKGIFITTAKFSKEAIETAKKDSDHIIILIDGIQLASLMIENMVGVREIQSYSLKEIDKDYFESL